MPQAGILANVLQLARAASRVSPPTFSQYMSRLNMIDDGGDTNAVGTEFWKRFLGRLLLIIECSIKAKLFRQKFDLFVISTTAHYTEAYHERGMGRKVYHLFYKVGRPFVPQHRMRPKCTRSLPSLDFQYVSIHLRISPTSRRVGGVPIRGKTRHSENTDEGRWGKIIFVHNPFNGTPRRFSHQSIFRPVQVSLHNIANFPFGVLRFVDPADSST